MSYALITGASKGIGKVIAFELAAKGYNILMVARSEDLLKKASEEIKAQAKVDVKYLAADLSSAAAAQQVFDWTAQNNWPVSILVNNAGYGLSGLFESYPLEQHLAMLQVNCTTLVQLTYLFLPQLKKQQQAHILNISSSAAYQAVPYLSLYAASKVFVLSFSRGLRYELRKTAVNVTCVCPGSTDTDFATRAQVGEKALKTAQKVNMTPEQVGKAAVKAMLSKKAEVITGAINKLGGFLTWLLPKKVLEGGAARIYE
ncbi:SDR family NAD(P)-dependent oxidoreductase [Flavisolibacter ginsenosidimutans]|uniref:SDR family oxidoreductase n=1 Tax=Flavisolibacter ginsenosidimutans TaxID=661481 RepID=A0A5B8UNL9_9BACT|nr:SDR family oxidoreductase [Flavisolibacter ginsenosidimutans]QEC58244.1 SDR family oxidoreductase [Flavisolibacter ginsenosidimutans]